MGVMNRFYVLEDNDNCLYQLTELHNNIIKKNAEAKAEKKRNWGDMPEDILIIIFMKLGAIGILFRAQSVCSAWRKLSKHPRFFRSINLCKNQWDFLFQSLGRNLLHYSELQRSIQVRKIVQEAIHRSCGQLDELALLDGCHDLEYLDLGQCVDANIGTVFMNLRVSSSIELKKPSTWRSSAILDFFKGST
ncbi:hypothetical protein FRX31_015869 [Thalictrum thalictroides]|uniref:F-box domain-containing protein n=1 Tax=Thalictrum thalictroides TaxID=46969 RepID=A0A7J6WB17_THATH|nr:hypothetical protein FRX31_015869 [Thalictrum thalictroides]